jgi:hypothetical protein
MAALSQDGLDRQYRADVVLVLQIPITLMYLDVSYNKLTNLDGLDGLPFLVHVNARHNFLQVRPVLCTMPALATAVNMVALALASF